jgi:hypothetical protein
VGAFFATDRFLVFVIWFHVLSDSFEQWQSLVMKKIDHPRTSPFSSARQSPSQFSDAARFRHQIASLRVRTHEFHKTVSIGI